MLIAGNLINKNFLVWNFLSKYLRKIEWYNYYLVCLMVKKIDAYLTTYFPILVAGYFIYNNSVFASHIFAVCWLSMVVNMSFVLETFNQVFTKKNSLLSVFNLLLFGILAITGFISMEGFLLSIIIGENGALILAIIYAFIFKKGVNNKTAWKTFGIGGTIAFILLFVGAIYPYLGEWILYLTESDMEAIVILGALTSFLINISRKIKNIEGTRKRNGSKVLVDKKRGPITNSSKFSPIAKHILISIGLWFFGLGTIYVLSSL